MNRFMDILKTRYEAVLQASSDSVFYQNIHSYIDYIVKTSKLAEIVNKAEKEYRTEHSAIWYPRTNDENELDKREERTFKLERFNLYTSGYCTLLMRIYYPLEIYKTTNEDDKDQDPCAMLMLKGINNSRIRQWMKESPHELHKWNPKRIKSFNKWYEGERKYYEDELRKFHIDFLTEVGKLEENKILPQAVKPEITFDAEKSILKIGDKIVNIKLKNDKPNSHYVLEYIFDNGLKEQAYYTDIIEAKFPKEQMEWRSMYRACNDINKKVSEQANVSNFLIIKTGKTGYAQVNSDYL